MKRVFVLASGLITAAAVCAQASQKIISFETAYRGAIDKNIEEVGGKVTRKFTLIDSVVAIFPDNAKTDAIMSIKGVTAVYEDKYRKWLNEAPVSLSAVQFPSVKEIIAKARSGEGWNRPAPFATRPSETEIPWGVKRVNASAAWGTLTGKGVKVCIIDTGVDGNHPDLAPNYKGGYNAVVSTEPPTDEHGHGTHVAGTIAAALNDKGVVGVAPNAEIYGVKVLGKDGYGQDSWVAAGVEWAIMNHMNVTNMSLGDKEESVPLKQMMEKADQAGITQVVAAGNLMTFWGTCPVMYPAKYDVAIAISASDSSDKIASFSCRGPEVDLIAPGARINSTKPGGGYQTMDGTSMACPHVAGLAALAVNAGAKTPAEVRAALVKAASPLAGLRPEEEGAGLVNAAKLLK
ncbi:MAG: S8 family peptidase [Elusimicrobiales bacterium]|jgi:subtilisin family serine protease